MYCKIGDCSTTQKIPNKVIRLWHNMLNRCYNENTDKWNHYGGKGVKICDEWLKLDNFFNDIKTFENYEIWLYNKNYSLDKDIKGSGLVYSKESCLFVDKYKQNQNTSKVKRLKVWNDNGYYKEFNSMRCIERELKIYCTKLRRILNNKCKNNTGYYFEFL